MKKSLINTLLLASVTPFLVQCASQSDVEEIRYQLRIVNKKIDDMKTTTVGQLQKRQAAAYGQMDQLEKDILELRSQLEESYHLNQRLREQNKELENSINAVATEEATKREEALKHIEEVQQEKEARLAALNEKLRLQEENLKAIQDARLREAERKAREAALAAELAKQKTKRATAASGTGAVQHITQDKSKVKKSVPQTAEPARPASTTESKPSPEIAVQPPAPTSAPKEVAPQPAAYAKTDDNVMGKATTLFDSNKFMEAYALFEEVAGSSGAGDAIAARYMMGECLFNEKEYDKAIMQYQKIISQYPDNSKAPAAMLKQAMAFEKLADKETAKVIYRKLIKKHGSTQEAAEAQGKLSKL